MFRFWSSNRKIITTRLHWEWLKQKTFWLNKTAQGIQEKARSLSSCVTPWRTEPSLEWWLLRTDLFLRQALLLFLMKDRKEGKTIGYNSASLVSDFLFIKQNSFIFLLIDVLSCTINIVQKTSIRLLSWSFLSLIHRIYSLKLD